MTFQGVRRRIPFGDERPESPNKTVLKSTHSVYERTLETMHKNAQTPVTAPTNSGSTPNHSSSSQQRRERQTTLSAFFSSPSAVLPSAPPQQPVVTSITVTECTRCILVRECISCHFCDRWACEQCTGECRQCGERFCSLCSAVVYLSSGETGVVCLDCYRH